LGCGVWVSGFGFRVSGFGSRASGLGLVVYGIGLYLATSEAAHRDDLRTRVAVTLLPHTQQAARSPVQSAVGIVQEVQIMLSDAKNMGAVEARNAQPHQHTHPSGHLGYRRGQAGPSRVSPVGGRKRRGYTSSQRSGRAAPSGGCATRDWGTLGNDPGPPTLPALLLQRPERSSL